MIGCFCAPRPELAEQVVFPAGGLMVTRQSNHPVRKGWPGDVGGRPPSLNCSVRPMKTTAADCLRLHICFAHFAVYDDLPEALRYLVLLGTEKRIRPSSAKIAAEVVKENVAEVLRQCEAELLFPQRLRLRAFSNMPIFSEVFSEMVVKLIDRAATLLSTYVGVTLPASC